MTNIRVRNCWLFGLGFLGVLSILPIIPELINYSQKHTPLPMSVIVLISAAQSALFLFCMVWLGSAFSSRVGLEAPLISSFSKSETILKKLRSIFVPSVLWGLVGGLFLVTFSWFSLPLLPNEFVEVGSKFAPPWYAKVLYGGITEEILIRWGLMSFLVWGSFRATQSGSGAIGKHNYIIGIVVASLIFGAGHLPALFALTSSSSPLLISYIIIGNAGFGLIAGFLFWKRGLESAILSHITAHITMIVCTALLFA